MYGDAGRGGFGFPEKRERVVDKIGLVEQDDGTRAAFPGEGDVTLDAARVEVAVERADQKCGVYIGGDDLLGRGAAGGLTRELAAPLQKLMDGGADFADPRTHQDPIADGGEIFTRTGGMAEFSRKLGEEVAGFGEDAIEILLFLGDARRDEIGAGGAGVLLFKEIGPTERIESEHGMLLSRVFRDL